MEIEIGKKTQIIIAILMLIGVAGAVSEYGNNVIISGWFSGDGGNITGLNATNIATGTLSLSRLPYHVSSEAELNSALGKDRTIILLKSITLTSNITVPNGCHITSNMTGNGLREVVGQQINYMLDGRSILHDETTTIIMESDSEISNVNVINYDVDLDHEYGSDYPVWTGTGISINGTNVKLSDMTIGGFHIGIFNYRTYAASQSTFENLLLDNDFSIYFPHQIIDVVRMNNIHIWPIMTNWAGTLGYNRNNRDGIGMYFNNADCIQLSNIFVWSVRTALRFNETYTSISNLNIESDGTLPFADVKGVYATGLSHVSISSGLMSLGWNTTYPTTGIEADNSNITLASYFCCGANQGMSNTSGSIEYAAVHDYVNEDFIDW